LRYLLTTLLAVATAAALQTAAAAATIKDCEKITAPDAYNLCLASFGPVAKEHELKPVPAGIGSGQMMRGHRRGHAHYAGRSGRRHGRQTMQISVAPSSGAAD
jgi:hypothetical protein